MSPYEKGDCLVCCHVEISQIIAPLPTLLIALKSPQLLWVHQVDLLMFGPKLEKLLNIEQIFNENSSKSKLKHHRGIWAHSW
jgi:hypothetical protein